MHSTGYKTRPSSLVGEVRDKHYLVGATQNLLLLSCNICSSGTLSHGDRLLASAALSYTHATHPLYYHTRRRRHRQPWTVDVTPLHRIHLLSFSKTIYIYVYVCNNIAGQKTPKTQNTHNATAVLLQPSDPMSIQLQGHMRCIYGTVRPHTTTKHGKMSSSTTQDGRHHNHTHPNPPFYTGPHT